MHEINIAKQLMEKIIEMAAGRSIRSITLEVGELCDFEPEEIKETLEHMSGWKVNTIEREGLIACSCGYKGKPKILEKEHGFVLFVCLKCSKKPRVLKGDGVKILRVE